MNDQTIVTAAGHIVITHSSLGQELEWVKRRVILLHAPLKLVRVLLLHHLGINAATNDGLVSAARNNW